MASGGSHVFFVPADLTPAALTLRHAPIADCARYDNLRRTI
jgi:hypothetical protein